MAYGCQDRRQQLDLLYRGGVLLPGAAWTSCACYAVIFYLYFIVKVPPLKRHPTALVVRKCVWESIYNIQFLWVPLVSSDYFYKNVDDCQASRHAALWSFVSQVCRMAGNLQLLVLAVDMHRSSANPFESFQRNAFAYNCFVNVVSFLSGFILLAMGNEVYGLNSNMTCWIQDTNEYFFNNWHSLFFLVVVAYAVWIYASYVVIVVLRRLKRGLQHSLTNRISILRRSQTYVLGYVIIGLVALLMECALYLCDYYQGADGKYNGEHSHNGTAHEGLRTAIAILDACGGIVSFFILYMPNKDELKAYFQVKGRENKGLVAAAVLEDLSLKPHLNSALRAEIVYFTTLGIRLASDTTSTTSTSLRTSNADNSTSKSQKQSNGPLSASLVESENSMSTVTNASLSSRYSFFFSGLGVNGHISSLDDFVFQGFNIHAVINSTTKLFTCTEIIESADDDETVKHFDNKKTRPSIALRQQSGLTGTSRSSDLDALQDQQRESLFDEMSVGVDETLDSYGYSHHDIRSIASNKRMSTRDRAISTLTNTHTLIKETIMKAALSRDFIRRSSQPVSFEFQDYLSDQFADIRRVCGIDDVEYANSFRNITKEKFSEGASGAFLYFSSDERYIVKTTSKDDMDCLLLFLPEFVTYLNKNPNSLLVRYLGAHSVTLHQQKLYFVVMKNVFCQLQLSERYDLKGSWVNRHFQDVGNRKKLHRQDGKESKCPLYRDNDLQHKINLQPSVAKAMHDQLKSDSSFLADLNLMDFSLLVGVTRKSFDVLRGDSESNSTVLPLLQEQFSETSEHSKTNCDTFLRDKDGGMNAIVVHGPATYYFGVIDILQQWNWQKKMERMFKKHILQRDGDGLSAIDPKRYAARFMTRCVVDVFENLEKDDYTDYQFALNENRRCRESISRESEMNGFSIPSKLATANPLLSSRVEGSDLSDEGSATHYSVEVDSRLSSPISERVQDDRHIDSWRKTLAHEV